VPGADEPLNDPNEAVGGGGIPCHFFNCSRPIGQACLSGSLPPPQRVCSHFRQSRQTRQAQSSGDVARRPHGLADRPGPDRACRALLTFLSGWRRATHSPGPGGTRPPLLQNVALLCSAFCDSGCIIHSLFLVAGRYRLAGHCSLRKRIDRLNDDEHAVAPTPVRAHIAPRPRWLVCIHPVPGGPKGGTVAPQEDTDSAGVGVGRTELVRISDGEGRIGAAQRITSPPPAPVEVVGGIETLPECQAEAVPECGGTDAETHANDQDARDVRSPLEATTPPSHRCSPARIVSCSDVMLHSPAHREELHLPQSPRNTKSSEAQYRHHLPSAPHPSMHHTRPRASGRGAFRRSRRSTAH
jgi:hypothetical protein